MKVLFVLLLFTACAGSPDRIYAHHDAYYKAYEAFLMLEQKCLARGGLIVFLNKHSTRIRRGYTLEDLRTAECR